MSPTKSRVIGRVERIEDRGTHWRSSQGVNKTSANRTSRLAILLSVGSLKSSKPGAAGIQSSVEFIIHPI